MFRRLFGSWPRALTTIGVTGALLTLGYINPDFIKSVIYGASNIILNALFSLLNAVFGGLREAGARHQRSLETLFQIAIIVGVFVLILRAIFGKKKK